MELQKIIIIILFLVLFARLLITIMLVRRRGGELYGRASLGDATVLFAKFAALFPAGLLFICLIGVGICRLHSNAILTISGFVLFITASVFLYFSLADLGRYTKIGLPKNDSIILQTNGIYRFSRNPMYLGVILLAAGSAMMMPTITGFLLGASGVFLHHKIILKEELFLEEVFGQQYIEYKSAVRRYL
ncbi:MAG: isoprenylcysteine carboxylmethyltransferase family protein [Sphingobacteriia bacterium]|nr:isoprenylcysteine carboxylmethyltransferase family protein [Sphingobacteriia bacterium]